MKYLRLYESLSLNHIRKQLPFEIAKGNADLSVRRLLKTEDKIDYDVYLPSKGINLQRPFVWTLEQKQDLIMSVIKDLDIRKITIIRDFSNSTIQIIDGKQRLSTILSFCNDGFPIDIEGYGEYLFSKLPKDIQNSILSLTIYSDVAYEDKNYKISDEDKINWFEKLNYAGTPADKEHLKNLKN